MTNILRSMFLLVVVCVMLSGCVKLDHSAYKPYLNHMPKSILVLPPVNNTANVHASDGFLSTVTMPLAEAGYYVYPVAVVDRLFKDNGVPTPGDMQAVPLSKISEIIGPDAVLYITVKEWTTTNILIDATTSVTMEYRLVDTKSGELLWKCAQTFKNSSSKYAQTGTVADLAILVIAAQAQSVAGAASDGKFEREAAANCNALAFYNREFGLLKGARSPDYAADQQRMREVLAKEDAEKNKK
jgi:hypothetical protein